MSGMGRPLQVGNPVILSAFHSSLAHQFLFLLGIALVLVVGWNVAFTLQQRRRPAAAGGSAVASVPIQLGPEPAGRRFLRIGFGLVWLLDGLLQLQSAMPVGMPGEVLRPAATGSPAWVHDLVNVGVTIWSNHPIAAATSVVWIQCGVGLALLVAPRGWWSRAAGGASVGWAAVVWVFGEAFGGIFAPGAAWAFGLPGAVVFYGVAGALLALPERSWHGPRLGRAVTAGLGAFFVGMAVLQAWPGRGTWQGGAGAKAGPLEAMVKTMATTSQPRFLSSWLTSFSSFDAAHGWGVNLFEVVALAAIGVALCTGRRRLVLAASGAAAVLCLATWVLVQDLGFFGGVGTDPNSMVPTLVLLGGGVLALLRQPATVAQVEAAVSPAGTGLRSAAAGWWRTVAPGSLARVFGAVAAGVVVLVGVVPMAAASTNPNADPIVTEAINGTPTLENAPAPGFTLTDQDGAPVSLAGLRGKTVALTFLDPVCTSDCPLIAQNFRQADRMLGSESGRTVFVAVVANPIYRSVASTDAFDRQEGLAHVGNWLYLTGSLADLTKVWNSYGVQVAISPAGAMVDHSEVAYVIDGHGRIRAVLDANPGTSSTSDSSFSNLLAEQMRSALDA
jgi:cytochrome oxidase Cu insertion factor (SCO1/SenC/PrrC family)